MSSTHVIEITAYAKEDPQEGEERAVLNFPLRIHKLDTGDLLALTLDNVCYWAVERAELIDAMELLDASDNT